MKVVALELQNFYFRSYYHYSVEYCQRGGHQEEVGDYDQIETTPLTPSTTEHSRKLP